MERKASYTSANAIIRADKGISSPTSLPQDSWVLSKRIDQITEGVDIVKVAARLGHANPKITLEIYAHLVPNVDNDLADIFHNAV